MYYLTIAIFCGYLCAQNVSNKGQYPSKTKVRERKSDAWSVHSYSEKWLTVSEYIVFYKDPAQ